MRQRLASSAAAPSQGRSQSRKPSQEKAVVTLPRALTVKQLADLLGVSPIEVIKRLMRSGIMATINEVLAYELAVSVAAGFGFEAKAEVGLGEKPAPKRVRLSKKEAKAQRPRPPVVTILGHVDHGKTSLLDAIRHSNVASREVGAITQHIGAYQVEVGGQREAGEAVQRITFIDTPGHEAFTAMRARGARATDIAVLVVAADDGIMPQTVEAVAHAKAAEVPIIVAINKIDRPNADPERVKQQLTENGLVIEEWGGDVICVPISAKTGEGIPQLLEYILVVAEMAELAANPNNRASGVIIDAKLDSTRGTLATVLVQDGTLAIGDTCVVGESRWGRVKAMFNDNGKRVKSAGPSDPVEIMGLDSVPEAGDTLRAVADEREARDSVQKWQEEQRTLRSRAATLGDISSQIRAGEAKGLNLILKADVQGSIEPLRNSLERLENKDAKVRVIHSATGSITESDVTLAVASKGVIVGFNTHLEPGARRLADATGAEVRMYRVIYDVIDDMQKALAGVVEPTYADVIEGHAEVRATFSVRSGKVAGAYVTDGSVKRSHLVRVLRGGQVIHESRVDSLKHFKNNVSEMPAGSECGIGIGGLSDLGVGDRLEFYRRERQ